MGPRDEDVDADALEWCEEEGLVWDGWQWLLPEDAVDATETTNDPPRRNYVVARPPDDIADDDAALLAWAQEFVDRVIDGPASSEDTSQVITPWDDPDDHTGPWDEFTPEDWEEILGSPNPDLPPGVYD